MSLTLVLYASKECGSLCFLTLPSCRSPSFAKTVGFLVQLTAPSWAGRPPGFKWNGWRPLTAA